jgi:hypothetical protein
VRLMRSTMDNAITTSPKGINKSRAATSQCANERLDGIHLARERWLSNATRIGKVEQLA